jgi:L-alanine-DL-glutamate epimerase-like enolase superfamily enzyme
MRIARLDIRACRLPPLPDAGLKGGTTGAMECLVLTAVTDSGLSATSLGFAGRSAGGAGRLAAASLRPFLVGRDARDREGAWADWRRANRWWHHLPIYSWGPVDNCLWLLAAQAAGQPLWRYLGGGRAEVPAYASSLVLPDAGAYAAEARAVQAAGFKAYKIHPPGKSLGEDIDIHRAVRAAVGPDFPLISDPVQPYSFAEALALGRETERLGFLWYEEPLPDEATGALAELTRTLDIPVIGGEVLPGHPYSIADLCARWVVDGVRADASWTGGVTGTLKTAHLAEAFHMPCEVHTAIFHPLDLVNLHLSAAISNCTYFEVLWPLEPFAFGLAAPLPIANGMARLPEEPGLGIAFDWNAIDNATLEVL